MVLTLAAHTFKTRTVFFLVHETFGLTITLHPVFKPGIEDLRAISDGMGRSTIKIEL
jgi:hypothetical protein